MTVNRAVILDGYTDEPAGLGVPPYIDVYPRYIAGALWVKNPHCQILYYTIDQVRRSFDEFKQAAEKSQLLIFIAGVAVPGKYLGGSPATLKDVVEVGKRIFTPIKLLCGPAARFDFGREGGRTALPSDLVSGLYDLIVKGDPDKVVMDLVDAKLDVDAVDPLKTRGSEAELGEIAVRGARIVVQHPNYPESLLCEIETYRGCPRWFTGGCSFCTEPLYGEPSFRPVEHIVREIEALHSLGVVHFRLGRQPDLFSYMAKGVGDYEFPEPNPEAIEKLFKGIRQAAPNLQVLHIDNVNPGTIAHHPELSEKIAKIVVAHHSPGDVAAFGVESADPLVVKLNNLKAEPEEALLAVEIINKIGAIRGENGLPHLLPGINFVYGLMGERRETYEYNYQFLKEILDRGLMIRRINLRQVLVFPNTRMWSIGDSIAKRHKKLFKVHKEKIRREIDLPMLRRVVPHYTVLRRVRTEVAERTTTYARQIGSYPILVAIPEVLPLGKFIDIVVVDHGFRSVVGLPYPIDINKATLKTLQMLPGIGSKRAAGIVRARPITSREQLCEILKDDKLAEQLLQVVIL